MNLHRMDIFQLDLTTAGNTGKHNAKSSHI